MIGPIDQRPAQIVRSVDRRAVRQLAGGVDRRQRVGIVGAELAHRVEVLQREPERIHHAVTREAGRRSRGAARAARAASCAGWPRLFSGSDGTSSGGSDGGVPSRRSRIHAPRSTGDVRFGIRRQHQDRALAQQAVARLVVERHPAEVRCP